MSQSVRVVRMPKIKYRMVSLLISLVRMGGMVWFGPFILVLFDFLGDCNGAALIAVGRNGVAGGSPQCARFRCAPSRSRACAL